MGHKVDGTFYSGTSYLCLFWFFYVFTDRKTQNEHIEFKQVMIETEFYCTVLLYIPNYTSHLQNLRL